MRNEFVSEVELAQEPPSWLFRLPYDAVRSADAPEQMLLDFYWTTYEAGAKLGHWDREALERKRESWDGSKVVVGEWSNNLVFGP